MDPILIDRKTQFQEKIKRGLKGLQNPKEVGSGHCPCCGQYNVLNDITPLWEIFTVMCNKCIRKTIKYYNYIIEHDLGPDNVIALMFKQASFYEIPEGQYDKKGKNK